MFRPFSAAPKWGGDGAHDSSFAGSRQPLPSGSGCTVSSGSGPLPFRRFRHRSRRDKDRPVLSKSILKPIFGGIDQLPAVVRPGFRPGAAEIISGTALGILIIPAEAAAEAVIPHPIPHREPGSMALIPRGKTSIGKHRKRIRGNIVLGTKCVGPEHGKDCFSIVFSLLPCFAQRAQNAVNAVGQHNLLLASRIYKGISVPGKVSASAPWVIRSALNFRTKRSTRLPPSL